MSLISNRINIWLIVAFIFAAMTLLPISMIILSLFSPEPEIWAHLKEHVLFEVVMNSVSLALATSILSMIIGVGLAWIIANFEFPLRKFFSIALLLPLAIPAYVTAFVVIGIFDYTGILQSFMRSHDINISLPDIRSFWGLVFVMTMSFYPYVYMITKNAFESQGKQLIEVSRSLGCSTTTSFFKISLPMAMPWIMAGTMLVMMETLADFGTVSVFNYNSFTTAIYKAWYNMFSIDAALKLASMLIILVFAILLIEQKITNKRKGGILGKNFSIHNRIKLRGAKSCLAFILCTLILLPAFILPMSQLLVWSLQNIKTDLDYRYFGYLMNSVMIALIVSVIITGIAIILSYAKRYDHRLITSLFVKISTLGYAVPGTVMAVAVYSSFVFIDNLLSNMTVFYDGYIMKASIIIMIIALVIRFITIGFNPIENGLKSINMNIDESSKTLGANSIKTFFHIHMPIIKGSMLTSMMLCFVDVIKEMPITLMTRPFGWDTLSVRVFEMTSEGEWERAALPAVTIVITGLIAVILMNRVRSH